MGGRGARTLGVMLLVGLPGGCRTREGAEPLRTSGASVRVERARARLTPAQVGAVYLSVVNATESADRLLSAESSSATKVELHEVVAREDVLSMVMHPEGFPIPAGGRVELVPGGKHLMLYNVRASADGIDLLLRFEKTGAVRLNVPVVAADEDMR
ncbi:copper chaperone PCu(A)C [Stigmatella aurantiaca]|uniref:DR1885-like metal-binding family protein n=1 Tax=Stigmatella aurantiaca (strain DW4/3-1) TaxID=378806 RepID=Q08PD5_STIAD|nr:copper chaperone PCu(A)C [Stigmatella aurantiaca]ADO68267.1 DR1885-like metal-binding family protein [Stigmatella aurantiaca DW4/3-1]EAU62340.1 signal peptide protein [Stigmatella aurantiaca DW4/3-1]